jgi:hypothetical protein
MNKFKNLMSKIDSLIVEEDKTAPVHVSGLLGRSKTPQKKQKDEKSPEAQIAKYIAMIRQQRKEMLK